MNLPEPGDPATEEGAEDEAASPMPPLADALMAPLLDAGAEVLRRLAPADLPPAARRLRAFDRRGLATPAARHQLRRLLEEDEELLGAAATVLLARPEAARLAEAWEQATAAGGGAPLALVAEASADGRLPFLASVLAAALPTGFEFGLGLVVAIAATADREAAAAQALRAATAAQAAAEEARRRADAARTAAEAEAARLDATLREERQARRQSEAHASGADHERSALEAALAEAQARAATADQRAKEAEKRLAALERRVIVAEGDAAEAQHRLAGAEQRALNAAQRAVDAEQRALDAAQQALDAERHGAARTERRTTDSPAPSREPPSRRRGRARRSGAAARRAAVQIPPGMQQDDPAAAPAMVRTPGVAIIVDGYNVSMLAWPGITPADQRERLCDALAEFQLRIRREVTVVFDGADVRGVRPMRRRELRIVFSAAGQEADDVLVDEVVFRPAEVPVIVVSSDREVKAAAESEGATVLTSDRFLQLLRR